MIALVVPVYKNFPGFAELMASVDASVFPIIVDNWNSNIGVAKAWNLGLSKSIAYGIDYTLICNDDIVFEKGTIGKMRLAIEQGLTFTSALNTRDFTPTEEEDYDDEPDFSCFMVNPYEFINQVGFFDENYFPAYFEDNDMHYRMKQAGFPNMLRRTDAPMFHKGSVTQNWEGGMVVSSPQFEMNRAYYAEKWGGVPGEERYTLPFNNPNHTIQDW